MDGKTSFWIIVGAIFALIFIANSISNFIEKSISQPTKEKRLLIEAEEKNKIEEYKRLIVQNQELKRYHEQKVREIDQYIKDKCDSYPHMAAMMADLLTAHYASSARLLEIKRNPARQEARRIRELKQETKNILQEKKEIEYKIEYIRKLFPNIDDIFDKGFNEETGFELETEQTTDRVRLFLSAEEYNSLSGTQKNQLALDRYLANRKSKWQIGRDYEMYIGYLYEKKGFNVQYTGIIKNLEDMGRDLVVSNADKTYIIQCKRWSHVKTIHEKHIFQLFGSVVEYNIENNAKATGVFVSTTELSPMAKRVAKELNIVTSRVTMGDFPRIKCNINKTTGEQIYHLPFDQQYDAAVVDCAKGECYAFTVKEAEEKGFRRAKRHYYQ
mgnify:CR=1 FL=1